MFISTIAAVLNIYSVIFTITCLQNNLKQTDTQTTSTHNIAHTSH